MFQDLIACIKAAAREWKHRRQLARERAERLARDPLPF